MTLFGLPWWVYAVGIAVLWGLGRLKRPRPPQPVHCLANAHLFRGKPGSLYVAKARAAKGVTFFKVGVSKNPKRRVMRDLNKQTPYQWELLEIKRHRDMRSALIDEAVILQQYKHRKFVPYVKFSGSSECLEVRPRLR